MKHVTLCEDAEVREKTCPKSHTAERTHYPGSASSHTSGTR